MTRAVLAGYVVADARARYALRFISGAVEDLGSADAVASGLLGNLLPEFDLASIANLPDGEATNLKTFFLAKDENLYELEANFIPVFDGSGRLDFCLIILGLSDIAAYLQIHEPSVGVV